jgi:phage gpG-like protein
MGLTGDFSVLHVLRARFQKLSTPAARLLVVRSVAEEYRTYMTECFHAGQSPYGQTWAPLKLRSSVGGRSQVPLSDTAIMRAAITPRDITESGFRVVVSHPGACVHQYGAVIKPKTAKALRFRGVSYVQSKSGRPRRKYTGWIFAKQVTIPARPYAPLNGAPPALDARVQEAADEAILELLGK